MKRLEAQTKKEAVCRIWFIMITSRNVLSIDKSAGFERTRIDLSYHLSEKYGVGKFTISDIKRNWKHGV